MGSISDLYGGASLIGPSQEVTIVASDTPVLINLVPIPTDGSSFVPAVFVLTIIDAGVTNIYFNQGDENVTPAATGATTPSFRIQSVGTFWRIDVDRPSAAYLSILSPDGPGTVCRITRIDSLSQPGVP